MKKATIMKIAGVQMDVQLADVEANVREINDALRETVAEGAELTVFPECATTGYCFENKAEAMEVAEAIPGPSTQEISAVCAELDTCCVVGMLEKSGDDLYNCAVLIGPEGVIGVYRKTHLPYLGVDRFTTPGENAYEVHQAGSAKIGMLICYDASFPEATRCLTIGGADIVVLPTNWPPGAETTAQYCINSRAVENGIYFIAVNRIGFERGFGFIGMSSISDPMGRSLANAKTTDREVLYATIDLERARNKIYERVPGQHVINRLADRRPELYGPLTEPHHLKTPHQELN